MNLHCSSHPAWKSSLFQTWICVLPATGPPHAPLERLNMLISYCKDLCPALSSLLWLPFDSLHSFCLLSGLLWTPVSQQEGAPQAVAERRRRDAGGEALATSRAQGVALLLITWCQSRSIIMVILFYLQCSESHSQSLLPSPLSPTPLSLISSFSLPSLGIPGVLLLQNKVLKTQISSTTFLQQLLYQKVVIAICSSWLEKKQIICDIKPHRMYANPCQSS